MPDGIQPVKIKSVMPTDEIVHPPLAAVFPTQPLIVTWLPFDNPCGAVQTTWHGPTPTFPVVYSMLPKTLGPDPLPAYDADESNSTPPEPIT